MKRGKPLARTPLKAKKRKPKSDFDKAAFMHMMAVKAMPCHCCGKPGPSDAHHSIHDRYSARKVSDWLTIPLCKDCHQNGPDAIHKGKASWRAKHGPDWAIAASILHGIGRGDVLAEIGRNDDGSPIVD